MTFKTLVLDSYGETDTYTNVEHTGVQGGCLVVITTDKITSLYAQGQWQRATLLPDKDSL